MTSGPSGVREHGAGPVARFAPDDPFAGLPGWLWNSGPCRALCLVLAVVMGLLIARLTSNQTSEEVEETLEEFDDRR